MSRAAMELDARAALEKALARGLNPVHAASKAREFEDCIMIGPSGQIAATVGRDGPVATGPGALDALARYIIAGAPTAMRSGSALTPEERAAIRKDKAASGVYGL